MLSPFLIVGVGGSGGKTLRALRSNLESRLKEVGWEKGIPEAWQFLHVDSPTNQDGREFPYEYLPTEDYVGLVPPGIAYRQQFSAALSGIPEQFRGDIRNALPSDSEVKVPVDLGAGMYRAIGRTLAVAKLGEIQKSVKLALQRIDGPDASSQLESLSRKFGASKTGDRPDVTVIIVSSIAGGSGAGQFIDVAEAIKGAGYGQPWIHKIFSVLYAPDVFNNVTGSKAIAPNALFAMTESMSGMWTQTIPEATIELYQSKGVNVSGNGTDPKIHVGPRYNYMVGIQNSTVNFENQTGVYKAVAASLSTWVTSELVQSGIGAYTIANFVAGTGVMSIDDQSGIKVPNDESAPFASLGFGRVGLGRDIFSKYAAERLTHGAISTLLDSVIKDDSNLVEKTREEYVELAATQSFANFLQDVRLQEDGDVQSDVTEQLRPVNERNSLQVQFRGEMLLGSRQGLNSKGLQTVENWVSKISYFYAQGIESKVRDENEKRLSHVVSWVQNQQRLTLQIVARYAAQQSIQVSASLVGKLIQSVLRSAAALSSNASKYQSWGSDYQNLISQAFSVGAQENLPLEHPMVQGALDRAAQCFYFRTEGDLLEISGNILKDFAENFLSPLKSTLDTTYGALVQTTAFKSDDTNESQFSSWPRFDDTQIPQKFYPARNEYMLLDIDDYPAEFERILNSSLGEAAGQNIRQSVLTQILMGALDPVVSSQVADEKKWQLIEEKVFWVPSSPDGRRAGEASSRARFEIATNPDDYIKYTDIWLNREGTAFGSYISEDLRNYLDENQADQSEFTKRLNKFREQLSGAVKASKPLIKLNAALLQAVHGTTASSSATLSPIPFGKGSKVFEVAKQVFIDDRIWDEHQSLDWFDSSISARRVDIFSLQNPYQPIVMDSILEPIGRTWLESRNAAEGREDFLHWRKARPLNESIAASPKVWKNMLRGWYVAKILSQLDAKIDSKLGPRLEIWSGEKGQGNNSENFEFPYPLLHVENVLPADYPGVVLYSLSIALVMCNLGNNLEPMDAYKRLSNLGSTGPGSELMTWILEGKGGDERHPVDQKRAGLSSGNWESRRDTVATYLQQQMDEFNELISKVDAEVKMGLPAPILTWEIRVEVKESLTSLLSEVKAMMPDETGV